MILFAWQFLSFAIHFLSFVIVSHHLRYFLFVTIMEFFKKIILKTNAIKSGLDIENKKKLPKYNQVICSELSVQLNSGALIVKRVNLGKYSFNTLLECIVCRKKFNFLIVWEDLKKEDITVNVFSDSTKCNHPDKQSTRPVKGIERTKVSASIQGKSTKSMTEENILILDEHVVKESGNLQNFKSSSVIRKIRSEMNAKDNLHKNPLIELHMMATQQNLETRFIQEVSTFQFTVTVKLLNFQNYQF